MVIVSIGAVGACMLWLVGAGNMWQQVRYDLILFSLFRYVFVGVGAGLSYFIAQSAVEVMAKDGLTAPTWIYIRCVLGCGLVGFVIGITLGTHVEDADPLRGGGEVVVDY